MTASTSSHGTPTAFAVSPDSGEHWTAEGAWEVSPGIHRIPLPLPMDGLKAINVYVITTDDGLVLIDGGWSIPVARDLLDRCLRDIGAGFGDIRRFLVTHVHRDHYTLARVLSKELGVDVALGRGEERAMDALNDLDALTENPFASLLRTAGAHDIAEIWNRGHQQNGERPDPEWWEYPDSWLDRDHDIPLGPVTLNAVETPGHTPGHYVFAEQAAGLMFTGDHVLPTITPSIGFTFPAEPQPLGDFMASLTKVRGLPDLKVLPAHGPVAPSTHARVDELLAFHDHRLELCLAGLGPEPVCAADVGKTLGWTRHETPYEQLDEFARGMAAMETKAHLDLLVARGEASRRTDADGVVWYSALA
ncbi:MBL fold metallo-hydrolase [Nocardioides sp.]|uniref:MBL fold metallo-hydrolase n=1 Tax=Nocardioides sp. TaxID=35761 RepID=UPI001A180159|nr:MBL fold metallo-hydrolase [Nocardioides sp.]MBJ7356938.1 MBL fold metallo-hydrolase [Nocardioides sp.]